jgi:hypothetical protein
MDINALMQPLAVTENPGLDSVDPRFMEITTLVQNGDYAGAASQAEEILEEGVYDIRIIVFYLYGLFIEQNPTVLTTVFQCLDGLLTQNWEAVGPVVKREKHAQNSLNWLVKQLLKRLQYEESAKGETWEQWIVEAGSDEVQETLDAAAGLQRSLGMALAEGSKPIMDGLAKIIAWLRGFQQVVYRELKSEPEPEPLQENAAGPSLSQSVETAIPARAMGSDADAPAVEGSYHLKVLMRKLQAFEQLIKEEKFPKAAIVASDINAILAGFDPKLYFPKLFARFSYLLATNITELAAYEDQKDTLEWHALEEYYKVDVDGFIEL